MKTPIAIAKTNLDAKLIDLVTKTRARGQKVSIAHMVVQDDLIMHYRPHRNVHEKYGEEFRNPANSPKR